MAAIEPAPRIYLQFDGLEEATHRAIRGRDLRAAKQRALDHCAEAGLVVILVAAIERGVNEGGIGGIVRFGVAHPAVRGVAFQPVTHSGRHVEFDPADRVTNADVIHALADQLPAWFRVSDFVPVLLPHLPVDDLRPRRRRRRNPRDPSPQRRGPPR